MTFRQAEMKDIESINDIYNQAVNRRYCTAHLEPVSMEERISWFLKHDPEAFPVFVYEEEGKVIGWISLSPYRENRRALSHVAEVSYYVEDNYQGRGVGTKLLTKAIELAPDFGFSVLIAILLDRNAASIRLLNKKGFTEWGCMPGIARVEGEYLDHLYYGLKLTPEN